jgi:putative alpha-1,2-mannosidase
MSHPFRVALAAALSLSLATPGLGASTTDDADPMVGTGGEGHTYPGATAPFGMVQLSPDTDTTCEIRACYGHAAGYRYDDPTIQGFSHTHFSGAGHSDLGDFLVMPVSGDKVPMEPGDPKQPGSGYRSRFSHQDEVAHPGYYAVTLGDWGVRAEMTAGTRIGVHRYSFPAGKAAQLVLALSTSLYNYPGKILWSSVRLWPDGTITGTRETRGWAPARKLYFAMRFSAPLRDHAFVNTEEKITYRGFQGPGRGTDAVAERLGLGPDKVYANVDRYGNTSAASVPIALDEALESNRIHENDLVMLNACGGGLTWGANLIRW